MFDNYSFLQFLYINISHHCEHSLSPTANLRYRGPVNQRYKTAIPHSLVFQALLAALIIKNDTGLVKACPLQTFSPGHRDDEIQRKNGGCAKYSWGSVSPKLGRRLRRWPRFGLTLAACSDIMLMV